MTKLALPASIQSILEQHNEPDTVLSALLPVLGKELDCDRCFLYLRNPYTKFGRITHCWRRNQDIPDVEVADWTLEPASLPQEDPMFAAALQTQPSIYVEDIETAEPSVLNKEFERENFGHRALIHAHLCHDGQLWGILQPCIFGQKRVWSQSDHAIITQLETQLIPLIVDYIKQPSVYSGF